MKIYIYTTLLLVTMLATFGASAQKYRTVADTNKLNKEYLDVSKDIASLTLKLSEAQDDLPGIVAKAANAESSAQSAAESSSSRADKVSEGSVKDAKRAKKSAKTAYKKAKTSQSANSSVKRQEKKIEQLSKQLAKKQKRLQELTEMRTTIYNSFMPAG